MSPNPRIELGIDIFAFGALVGIKDANAAEFTQTPTLATSVSYTGREYDSESELYYYRARYYDPVMGRFLQMDPDPGSAKKLKQLINRYGYTENNPINFVDPSGKISLKKILWGVVIGALVVGTALFIGSITAAALGTGTLATVLGTMGAGYVGSFLGGVLWEELGLGSYEEGAMIFGRLGGLTGGFGSANPEFIKNGFTAFRLPLDKKFLGDLS